MQKLLFIDRDGTLVMEPPVDYQLDSLEKLEYYPTVFRYLAMIVEEFDYQLVMVTNQDGLGTDSFPEETFWPAHNKMMKALENEGIFFQEVLIDRSFPHENAPTRKPRTGLVEHYMQGNYDLANSFVIGDRTTDIELAKNMGAKGILLGLEGYKGNLLMEKGLQEHCVAFPKNWKDIYLFLKSQQQAGRKALVKRQTKETNILVELELDGKGISENQTGIGFFDHMLDQLAKHSGCNLKVLVEGDLHIDEHHTIEDTSIALGQAFKEALGNKLGIERYGHYSLPMDDCLAELALDFGGRPWLIWEADFNRERVGGMPTEMFFHFFKSFSDAAACNLSVKASGQNEHHKIEAIFKAWARAIKMAIRQDENSMELPSTKGML